MDTPSNHHPEVYALPRDHDVVPQSRLEPCEDLSFLLDKYRRDVSAILGVPHEMVIGREGAGHETARKTVASGRIFSTNMHEICRHLQTLLRQASVFPLCIVFLRGLNLGPGQVYCSIYEAKAEEVEFILVPMPRLEIETIQDFKVLFEIGALTPDMTVKLSRVLLGEDPGSSRSRKGRPEEHVEQAAGGSNTGIVPSRPPPAAGRPVDEQQGKQQQGKAGKPAARE